jgi:hypothetical protein
MVIAAYGLPLPELQKHFTSIFPAMGTAFMMLTWEGANYYQDDPTGTIGAAGELLKKATRAY